MRGSALPLMLILLALAPADAGPLEVTLRDAVTGEPLAGAIVEVAGPEDDPAHPPRREAAPTGEDGVARFADGAAGRWRVSFAKAGYAPAPPELPGRAYDDPANGFVRGAGATRLELYAAPPPPFYPTTGSIRGRVTASPGDKPVRDAGVSVKEGARGERLEHVTATNAYGTFAVYGVAPGPARVVITASGYPPVTRTVTIPPGRTVDFPVALGAGTGRIVGSLFSEGGVPIPQVHVSATRSDGILITSTLVDVRGGRSRAATYALEGVPAVPPGSTLSYTVRAACPGAAMTNPAQGVTGLVVRAPGQTVTAQPIYLKVAQGGVTVTLYHPSRLCANETESLLAQVAPQAVVNVEGTAAYGRYLGEGPAHFYQYAISGAPSGQRRLRVSFPGHVVAPGQENVFIPIGGETRVLVDLLSR